jgi:hypothetical protein
MLLSGCAATSVSLDTQSEGDGNESVSTGPEPFTGLSIVSEYPVAGMEYMNEFDRYVDVFGVVVIGAGAPDDKLLHTAGVLAQYLDNTADGRVDDPSVVEFLVQKSYVFPVWTAEVRESFWATSCCVDKINMAASTYSDDGDQWALGGIERSGDWDSNLEEVWHVVSRGFYGVYPEDFSIEGSSSLTRAMDAARGGYFLETSERYPASAWSAYDDDAP